MIHLSDRVRLNGSTVIYNLLKFIDNFACVEKMFVPDSFNIFSAAKPVQNICARKCEMMYRIINKVIMQKSGPPN